MSLEGLSPRDLALVDAVAARVVELLEQRKSELQAAEPEALEAGSGADQQAAVAPVPQLVDAAELARLLGVSRSTVYDHAEEWGGVRIGPGQGAAGERNGKGKRHGGRRLRFDIKAARAAMSRSTSEPSHGADRPVAAGDQPRRPTRPDPRLPAGLPEPGAVLPIKPLRTGRRRTSSVPSTPETRSAG